MDQNGMQIEDNVLTEYHGTEKEVVVPAGVKVIRERVFRFNLSVERVVLPDTVEIIREEAFQYSTLQSIRIPPQVRELPERAFMNCVRLTDLQLPEGLERIGGRCFAWCKGLGTIRLPDSLQKLEKEVFIASGLESLRIPPRVTQLPRETFKGCERLADLQLPEGLQSIGSECFAWCKSLKTIRLPDSLRDLWKKAFAFSSLEALRLPPRIRELPEQAFSTCRQLRDLQLPEGLKEIGKECFWSCENLRSLRLPDSLEVLQEEAFSCSGLETLRIPPGIRELPEQAFSTCRQLRDLQLPEGMREIGRECFYLCRSLKTVRLPDSLRCLGPRAFADSGLVSLRVPPGVTSLPTGLFRGCRVLAVLDLHGQLRSIDRKTFEGCEALKTVRFPSSVSSAHADVLQPLARLGLECLEAPGIPLAALPPELRHPGVIGKANWLAQGNTLSPELEADLDAYLNEAWPMFLREAAFLPPLLQLLQRNRLLTRPAVDVLLSRVAGTDQPEAMALLLAYQGQLPLPDPEDQNRRALWELETGALRPDTFDASWTAHQTKDGKLSIVEYHGEAKDSILIPAARGDTPVVALRDGLFRNNPHIVSVTIPEGIRTMGKAVFAHCHSLRTVDLPSTLKKLPENTFEGCDPLPQVRWARAPGSP